MAIKSMSDLFLHTLKDIYFAENKIVQALLEMSAKASSTDLRAAFDAHLAETHEHIERLTEVFSMVGQAIRGKMPGH